MSLSSSFWRSLAWWLVGCSVPILLLLIFTLSTRQSLQLVGVDVVVQNPNPVMWQISAVDSAPTVLVYGRAGIWQESFRLNPRLLRDQYVSIEPIDCDSQDSLYATLDGSCTHATVLEIAAFTPPVPNPWPAWMGSLVPPAAIPEPTVVEHESCSVHSISFDSRVSRNPNTGGREVRMALFSMNCGDEWLLARGYSTSSSRSAAVDADALRFVRSVRP